MFRSRLYWKVFANFALLLLIMTALTVLTVNILSQVERSYAGASADVRTLDFLNRINIVLTDVPAAADEYALTASPDARKTYAQGWKDFDELVAAVQQGLPDTSQVALLRDMRAAFFEWMRQVGDPKMLLREGADQPDVTVAFRQLSETEARARYLPYARMKQRELRQRVAQTQFKNIDLANNLSRNIGTFIVLVNVLLAVFAVALGLVLTRSITTPIRLLRKGTESIIAGKFEPVELHRKDELGELAAGFNEMSLRLGNNYNRLNAYSELVTALNTFVDLDDVVNRSLDLLCQHSGSAVGALYLYSEETRRLQLAAGYALKQGGELVRSYGLGEGIPGEVALQRRPLEVTDLSAASAFTVDTGLVELAPRYIYAVPIVFRDRLIGVLVFGSMQPYDDLRRDIVMNSAPQVGVAITNAQNNEAALKLSREIATKNEELNQKNAELEKAYRVKSDFLASMSHELRTPLNSIIGFSSVLLGPSGDPLSKDQRMALEKVLKNGKHLLQLINDILDFSKLESGRMTVNVDTDDVPNVVSNSVMTVEALVKQKNLTLRVDIAPNLPVLKTDILKVKQILVNLLSNAVKFTEKGEVLIRASQVGDKVAIAVKDSGIGIERKNWELVFEEFQQIDSSNARKYKGTGLGLPISRRLARMMGGDLTVESEPGKGSTFTLTIPPEFKESGGEAKAAAAPAAPPVRTPAAPPPMPVKTPAAAAAQAAGVKILCVDDDPDAIEILRNYLVPEGYAVTAAYSGDEGLKLAEQIRPSLITLDIMMPGKDGWQVLRELKHNPATRDIPVVIHSMIDNKPLALALGAMEVMPKPVEASALLSLVQRVCKDPGQYVLVIDQSPEHSSNLKKILDVERFKVQVANTGAAALEMLKSSPPSLIFVDVSRPVMDGFEVLRKLAEHTEWSKIPLVILSAKELTENDRQELVRSIREQLKKGGGAPENLTAMLKRVLTQQSPPTS